MSILKKKNAFGDAAKDFEKKLLLKKIAETSDLPIPNVNIIKLVKLFKQEDVDLAQIINVVNQDQTLVAKILKLINSGYYGIRKKIDSVDQAICLIGLMKLKQVVYSASFADWFTDEDKLDWEHAYSSSVLMAQLVTSNNIPVSTDLPLSMLMHDIGKILLKRFSPKKYSMAVAMFNEGDVSMHDAEEHFININHAEAGAYLLKTWEMEDSISVPIHFHHTEDNITEDFLLETALVQIVNWIDCRAREIRSPHYPSRAFLNAAGIEAFDREEWVSYQRNVLAEIAKENREEESKNSTEHKFKP